MTDNLKLYVWDKFSPDYSSGLAVAIAPDAETAELMVIERMGYDPGEWGDRQEFDLDEPVVFVVAGGG